MKSGTLDRRIAIERATHVVNAFNERVATWGTLMVVWAHKQDISDGERVAFQQIAATVTTRFQLRWSTLAASISPLDRIRYDNRIYDIYTCKEIGRQDGIEITAAARAEREPPSEVVPGSGAAVGSG
jgi:SPP1 family predicted phage head-tail adaptor